MFNGKHRVYQWITVSGALILVLLLTFSARMRVDRQFADYSADEAAVTLALSYMNDAKGPMKGIKMLDKIAETHPDNVIALNQLAQFSMQTGQYARAVGRYESLVKVTKGDQQIEAIIGLSNAAELAGDTAKAITSLKQLFDISKDSVLLQSAKQKINLLRKP